MPYCNKKNAASHLGRKTNKTPHSDLKQKINKK